MATGDYTRRVTATSHDEVGELASAFNTMAADLEAVDRQRRELVANVSHELRTPVSALRAVLENLVDGVGEPDHATLGAALDQTERLSRLVTDLLDLSRVDAGIVPLRRERLALQGFLDETVAEARLTGRQVSYVVRVDPPDLSARFTFITPNMCSSMHDCSVNEGDAWLSRWMPKFLDSPQYQAGNTAVFLTFDEDDHSANNHIATLVMAPSVPAGMRVSTAFDHYSMLRTTEELLGISTYLGRAATATSMRDPFHL